MHLAVQIKFESVKEGRLIKRFCADFAMSALKGKAKA